MADCRDTLDNSGTGYRYHGADRQPGPRTHTLVEVPGRVKVLVGNQWGMHMSVDVRAA